MQGGSGLAGARALRGAGGALLLGLALLLAGCGGGGGGDGATGGGGGTGGTRPETLTLGTDTLSATATVGEASPVLTMTVTVNDLGTLVYGAADPLTRSGVENAGLTGSTGNTATVSVYLKLPSSLAPGGYSDEITVSVCFDNRCERHVKGSPARVRVNYTVLAGSSSGGGGGGGGGTAVVPEPGMPALVFDTQSTLPHDVVDAEFSRALNAVVMVTAQPEALLVVRDADTGAVRQASLPRAPKALSISPDGLSVAVGHDALISHFDLRDLALAPRLLNVSAEVGDLVLDARAKVHVFPAVDQWVDVHSVDVATNTEQRRGGPRAGTRVRLHPDGVSIYGANNGLSPDDIERYDIAGGVGTRLRDSPYHGDHPMCGNVWISESGSTLYTACGRSFTASADADQDMRYAGTLVLSTTVAQVFNGFRALSLSEWTPRHELVLIEEPWYECTIVRDATCVSHLAVYDSVSLARSTVLGLQPVEVDGTARRQRGLFVFHRNDGARLVISRLDGVTDATLSHRIGVVP